MRNVKTWTCDGCGREQELRKIDSHRWVETSPVDGENFSQREVLQLCPSCQVRMLLCDFKFPE